MFRFLLAQKLTTSDISRDDINASILGELLEEFSYNREANWFLPDSEVISKAKSIKKQRSYEFENWVSEDIWNVITGKIRKFSIRLQNFSPYKANAQWLIRD